jgi:phosphohistidine phosphatase
MKNIFLIRHAKSSWDDSTLDDFKRPLNSRGEKDAPKMGKRLKQGRLTPDVVLTSPAKRAIDTCLVITKFLGFDQKKIISDNRLYHASEDMLLKIIRELKDHPKDDEENILLFGHNPGLTDFANRLMNGAIENIPTCGIVSITLHIKKWSDAQWGCGEMMSFDFPKSKKE